MDPTCTCISQKTFQQKQAVRRVYLNRLETETVCVESVPTSEISPFKDDLLAHLQP